MGLSDQERMRKVYFSLSAIDEIAQNIGSSNRYIPKEAYRIKEMCNNLWPLLLASQGNSSFWLTGPDEEVSFNTMTSWSIALSENIKHCKHENPSWLISQEKDFFDPFEKGYLSIENTLSKNYEQPIYKIYQWLQHIQYAINRYDDNFLQELANEIARIEGLCFKLFHEKESFSCSWLIHEICKKIYGPNFQNIYSKKELDVVQKFLVENRLHLYFPSLFSWSFQRIVYLKQMLRELELDCSVENRMHATIIAYSKFLSEHPIVQNKTAKYLHHMGMCFDDFRGYLRIHEIRREKKHNPSLTLKRQEREYLLEID